MRKSEAIAMTLAVMAVSSPALAHTGQNAAFALKDGLLHPLQGLDHLLAMVAVGFWAAQLGGRAVMALPAAFVMASSIGTAAAMAGIAGGWTEQAILASLVALGAAITLNVKLPVALAVTICSLFAVAHGQAHGHEASPDPAIGSYLMGLVFTTAVLHAAGVALGRSLVASTIVSPALGIAVAAAGIAMAMP